jgi:hypothetical protein
LLPQAEAEFEERSRKSVVGVRVANAILILAPVTFVPYERSPVLPHCRRAK